MCSCCCQSFLAREQDGPEDLYGLLVRPVHRREQQQRFGTVFICGKPSTKKSVCCTFFSQRRLEPHRRKNYSTVNRTDTDRMIYHKPESRHTIPDYFLKAYRTAPSGFRFLKIAPNRTVGCITKLNRTLLFTIISEIAPNCTVEGFLGL